MSPNRYCSSEGHFDDSSSGYGSPVQSLWCVKRRPGNSTLPFLWAELRVTPHDNGGFICIYMYICMCVYMYVYIYIYLYLCEFQVCVVLSSYCSFCFLPSREEWSCHSSVPLCIAEINLRLKSFTQLSDWHPSSGLLTISPLEGFIFFDTASLLFIIKCAMSVWLHRVYCLECSYRY